MFESPFEAIEILDWKLSFALVALSVCIVSQAVQMHVLSTERVRAQCVVLVWVDDLSADADWLQLGDVAAIDIIESLSKEENFKIVLVLV